VLVVGGVGPDGQSIASAEFYDRNANFSSAAAMSSPRSFHTATLLPHERVLIAGGVRGNEPLSSAELYNAELNRFFDLPSMSVARVRHAAVALPGGNVLLVGGSSANKQLGIAATEIFDLENGRFVAGGSMLQPRWGLPDPVILSGGKVLVVGGARIQEIYDAAKNTSAVATSTTERFPWYQSATLLSDGNVLVAGGSDQKGQRTAQSYIYVP